MREGVLVVEDDPFVRRSIVRQVGADAAFEVVGEASDLVGARAAIEQGRAKYGVFDLQLSDGHSRDVIPFAVERGVAVLVLTVWDDDENVYRALAAGAGGYILKSDAAAGRVTESLAVLREGGAPISPMIARRLLDDFRQRAERPEKKVSVPPEMAKLTEREREIMELFAKGATYDEVAAMLSMSINTVRHHVRSLYRKLHVCSKAEAVTAAFGRE